MPWLHISMSLRRGLICLAIGSLALKIILSIMSELK